MKKILALVGILVGVVAHADTTSTATQTAVAPSIREKVTLSYLGYMYGPSVRGASELSANLPDSKDKVTLFNRINAGYKVDKEMSVGVAPEFYLKANPAFELRDAYLRLSSGNIYTAGNFKINGDILRTYLPLSSGSQKANKVVGLRTAPNFNYEFAGSRWSFTAYTLFQKNFYSAAADKQTDMFIRITPLLNYQLTPKLGIYGVYDYGAGRAPGTSLLNWTAANDMVYDLGFGYDVTPSVNVGPYLELPANLEAQKTLGSLTINLSLSAKLL